MNSTFGPTYSHLPLVASAIRRDAASRGSADRSLDGSFVATARRALTTVLAIGFFVFVGHAVTDVAVTSSVFAATLLAGVITAAVLEVNRRWHPVRVAGPFDAVEVSENGRRHDA